MNNVSLHILQFEKFVLDADRRSLKRDGRHLSLRPQAMEVLCYLAMNPGRPVSKEELFQEIWPGISVTDDSLVQCIRDIRQVLEDNDHRIVKTVPRRGYLFAGLIARDDRPISSIENDPHSDSAAKRFKGREIKLVVIVAVGILALWGIVHWFVSTRWG